VSEDGSAGKKKGKGTQEEQEVRKHNQILEEMKG
jgi:hypothetical protein